MDTQKARCVECRSEISVPGSYAHGDHVKCPTCGTRHKVVRSGEAVRLVLADITPLKEALRANEAQVSRLEAELRHARHSFRIGVNGIGFGVVYVVWPHAAHPPKPRHKRSLVYKCPAEPKWWERGCATIVKA